jgi:hypothetical protein
MSNITDIANNTGNNHVDEHNQAFGGDHDNHVNDQEQLIAIDPDTLYLRETAFEEIWTQKRCIKSDLNFRFNILNSISRQNVAFSYKDGRLYDYKPRFERTYVDGIIIDYLSDDDPPWNTRYGSYQYKNRTKEKIFENYVDLFL